MRRFFLNILALTVLAAFVAGGQQISQIHPDLAEGLRYVEGLQGKLFLPDIADEVLSELEGRFPEARAHVARLKLKGDLTRGLFDKVVGVIKSQPDQDSIETWSMKLALADAYYAYGKYAEAKGIYAGFFKAFGKNTPEALRQFYTESAYKYAQMLLYLKELKGALEAYKLVVAGELERHVKRQCEAEMADICLRLAGEVGASERESLYRQVEELADKLLWVQDIWFGKAIVLKAHVAMLRGKPAVAKKLVDDYMPTLQAIHETLLEQEAESGEPLARISPMSECRYLLAVMLQEESERQMAESGFDREAVLEMLIGTKGKDGKRKGDGAYQHFINVFLKYPESAWAPEAGERAEQVRQVVSEVFGGNIKVTVTAEQTAKVRTIQYREARMLYSQGQLDNAIEALTRVLNQFPDVPEAVGALGDLARSYMQTVIDIPDHELYADLVIGHLAERFAANPETRSAAGDEVIRLAEYWLEGGRADKRALVYDLFFDNYSDHVMAPSYLLSFGEKSYQSKDYPTALHYFDRVIGGYSNSVPAFAAMNRRVSIFEETGDVSNQLAAITLYVEALAGSESPGQELMNAKYRQAQAYKDIGVGMIRGGSTNETEIAEANSWLSRAAAAFITLERELRNPDARLQSNEREKRANASLREAALYNMAYCLSQVTRPKANIGAYRLKAIESYESLVSSFPESNYAPAALIQVGSLWTIEHNAAKAEAALSQLLRDYPETNEARSALPMIADNLMKLGMREEAVPRYRQMFAESGSKYRDSDLLRAAQVLTEAKEFDLAQQGLDRVLGRASDDAVVVPARLAQGRLLLRRGKFAEAVEALGKFIEDYEGYALTLDANEMLTVAASEAGMRESDDVKRKLLFNAAVDAIKQVRQRRTNIVEIATLDIEVGRMMTRKSKAEAEFGKLSAAEDSRGKAIISYLSFIDTANPANAALAGLIQTAYFESVPLLLEHKRWEFAAGACEEYLTTFPKGRYVPQMRTWLNQAHIELGGARSVPGSGAGGGGNAEGGNAEAQRRGDAEGE